MPRTGRWEVYETGIGDEIGDVNLDVECKARVERNKEKRRSADFRERKSVNLASTWVMSSIPLSESSAI